MVVLTHVSCLPIVCVRKNFLTLLPPGAYLLLKTADEKERKKEMTFISIGSGRDAKKASINFMYRVFDRLMDRDFRDYPNREI